MHVLLAATRMPCHKCVQGVHGAHTKCCCQCLFCLLACRFAQSQRLLTLPRLLYSTGTAILIPLAVLGLQRAAIVWATVLLVTVCSGYYGHAIIGGVVGDYLGATIQVGLSD